MSVEGSKRRHLWALLAALAVLLAMVPPSQAARLQSYGGPCVHYDDGEVSINDCTTTTTSHPTTSGSEAFTGTNATAVEEDIRVSWAFNESGFESDVVAFHVKRGQDPHVPSTMEDVATLGADVDTYLDDAALIEGAAWYIVVAELADGSQERSQPFRVSGVQAGIP